MVHAAGVLGKLTPAPHILPRDFASTVAVNVESAWRVIRTCGPLLLVGEAGRAVFITDGLVASPRAYWGLYGATKAAMHHLALSWAEEVRTTRCRVNLFDPGPVATRLRKEAMPGEDPATLRFPEERGARHRRPLRPGLHRQWRSNLPLPPEGGVIAFAYPSSRSGGGGPCKAWWRGGSHTHRRVPAPPPSASPPPPPVKNKGGSAKCDRPALRAGVGGRGKPHMRYRAGGRPSPGPSLKGRGEDITRLARRVRSAPVPASNRGGAPARCPSRSVRTPRGTTARR